MEEPAGGGIVASFTAKPGDEDGEPDEWEEVISSQQFTFSLKIPSVRMRGCHRSRVVRDLGNDYCSRPRSGKSPALGHPAECRARIASYSPNNSLCLVVCARLTGISVCFFSS